MGLTKKQKKAREEYRILFRQMTGQFGELKHTKKMMSNLRKYIWSLEG